MRRVLWLRSRVATRIDETGRRAGKSGLLYRLPAPVVPAVAELAASSPASSEDRRPTNIVRHVSVQHARSSSRCRAQTAVMSKNSGKPAAVAAPASSAQSTPAADAVQP